MDAIIEKFKDIKYELEIDDIPAAILALAGAITGATRNMGFNDSLGHEISVGLRHGLFGASASIDNSILELKEED